MFVEKDVVPFHLFRRQGAYKGCPRTLEKRVFVPQLIRLVQLVCLEPNIAPYMQSSLSTRDRS